MTRLVFWALIFYFIYLVWKFLRGLRRTRGSPPREAKRLPQMMVKDEMCNTYLPMEEAIKEIHEGKEHYFCSRDCRQKFLDQKKNPT